MGAEPVDPGELAGVWKGAIDIAGAPLEIVVRLVASDGALSGVIDIPAQGAFDIPLGEIQVAGEEIRFRMAGIPGDPEFHGVLNGSNIEGDFTQGGVTFPFHVTLESTSG